MQEEYEKIIEEKERIINEYKKKVALLETQLEYYKKAACIDPLTKLYNRRAISYTSDCSSVIMADIDYFKRINDKYGHEKGDEVLESIGEIFQNNVRNTDRVCRWGGEEFAIFLKSCDLEAALAKAMVLREKVSQLNEKFEFNITMSFGVTDAKEKNVNEAIREADQAMYESKKNGRDRVTIYTPKLEL